MISDKFTLLNQTVLDCFNETDEKKIIKTFTEVGINVLEADYGFVWINSHSSNILKLEYKSENLPFKPRKPREKGRNYKVIESGKIDFVSDIKKSPNTNYILKYIKSFVIIPICYRDKIYGSIVICFKKKEDFSKDKRILCSFIGNSLAQAITINRLHISESEAKTLSEKNEAYFRALVKNSNEVIMVVDEKSKILYISPSIYRISGYDPKEMVGHHTHEFLYSSEGTSKLLEFHKKLVDNPGIEYTEEFEVKHKSGIMLMAEATAINMLGSVTIKGIVVNIRDITERKNIEKSKENERLLEEEKKKISFIAEANHELRTPIAIIKGNVDLVLRDAGKRQRRYADNVLRNIDEEVKHISNILSDFTMLTSSNAEISDKMISKKVNLKNLIDKIVKRSKVIANQQKITIKTSVPNLVIDGDEKYLDRLFINLVKNAISYGKNKGWIKISSEKTGDLVKIMVSDNGIGVSKEDLSSIFQRFYRADKSHSSIEKHTGLGLAIAKWIAEAHGGKIEAESELGKGSVFTVSLPIKAI
jgi:PAS domain S-box-containing protein